MAMSYRTKKFWADVVKGGVGGYMGVKEQQREARLEQQKVGAESTSRMMEAMFEQEMRGQQARETERVKGQQARETAITEAEAKKDAERRNAMFYYNLQTQIQDGFNIGMAQEEVKLRRIKEQRSKMPFFARTESALRKLDNQEAQSIANIKKFKEKSKVISDPNWWTEMAKKGEVKSTMKRPTWGQEQKVAGLKDGIKRGHVVIGKDFGEPDEFDIQTQADVYKAIGLSKLDPQLFQEELAMYESVLVQDPQGNIGEINRYELEDALREGYKVIKSPQQMSPRKPAGATGKF